jgi:hypothetical protein
MAPPPIEDIVRQFNAAFSEAFPPEALVESKSRAPTTRSKKEKKEDKKRAKFATKTQELSCMHLFPKVLEPQLPHKRLCPTCTITSYIDVIRQVQKELEDRGGWSVSKEMGDGHKTMRQAWREAKIGLMNTVSKLEGLLADATTHSEVLAAIKPALDVYGKNKVLVGRVPGVQYVEGAEEDEVTEEDHDTARLMCRLLTTVLDKELEPEDKTYSSLQALEESIHSAIPQASKPPDAETLPTAPITPRSTDTAMTDMAMTMDTEGSESTKSILKRKSSISSTSRTTTKRIRMTDTATVSPSHVVGPAPVGVAKYFVDGPPETIDGKLPDLSPVPTTQPHAAHTIAEQRRGKINFWRPSPGYTPGPWASGAHEEKLNTSEFKVSWEKVDEQAKKAQRKEEEGEKIAEGLKEVSGLWISGWWMKNVVPGLDLEQLQEAMRGPGDPMEED